MTYFLTSSPCPPDSSALNPANGFVDELKKALPETCRALFIASDPDDDVKLRRFAEDMESRFAETGIRFAELSLLFRETQDECGYLLTHADVIFLCGGHVPTQNKFFQEINLRERLADFDGVVVGVSAGSMNSAGVVYAQPEEPGEAVDPDYQKFLPGLGLTKHNTIPHYNQDKDWLLDGLRLYEDMAEDPIVTLGTDAHSAGFVGRAVEERQALLRECGFRGFCTFQGRRPVRHDL